MKKLVIILLVIILIGTMAGCNKSPKISDALDLPEAAKCGGYEIQTEELFCCLVADGNQKYVRFQSVSGMGMEFYIGPTETIMLFTKGGQTSYYIESYLDKTQIYPNPMERVLDDLRTLDFYCISAENEWVYEAVKIEQISDPQQVAYTVYTIEMDWTDGEHYTYKYYVYEDGATLISVEAPKEINPLLFSDTPWRILENDGYVVNHTTGEKVPFIITNIATGKALSPNGSSNTIETRESIFVYIDPSTKQIIKINFGDGSDVKVLYDVDIPKPQITETMTEMSSETCQTVLMLVQMVESLI